MAKQHLFICLLILATALSGITSAQHIKSPFTVADEIGLTLFGDPNGGQPYRLHFSPDRNYLAIESQRGRLDVNKVVDSLRFYRTADIVNFLTHLDVTQPPSVAWAVTLSDKKGSIISDWQWLADSSGVAFLERTSTGNKRIVLADLQKRVVVPLTSAAEAVAKFDIRDRQHYAYTAVTPAAKSPRPDINGQMSSSVGTGLSFYELLLPDDPRVHINDLLARSTLWAVVGDERFEVKHDGASLVPQAGEWPVYLALSPDGRSLVTTLPVSKAPPSWETLYPSPYASSPYRIRAGQPASRYVRIDLKSGLVQPLTDAPIAYASGWQWAHGAPSWSSDGQAILLPNTFVSSKDHVASRPCVAVVDLTSETRACVETLQGPPETGWEKGAHTVESARFADGDKHRVFVITKNRDDSSYGTTEYQLIAAGTWKATQQLKGMPGEGHDAIEVTVKQGLNEPPQLVATRNQTARAIWDPNPQLNAIELVQARVQTWKDKDGREWTGGLYLPGDYKLGRRYPLVVQTHGFTQSEFKPSGVYPTAFAARALAATGIAVLQIREPCAVATPSEGPCAAEGYDAAINKLVSEGLADPEKIGIIGFSRTCFYVMQLLTTSSRAIRAASITDGQMVTYLQYLETVGSVNDSVPRQFDFVIGAQPFGAGLQQWLKRSPGFNLDKIAEPLLVVAEGPLSLLSMWEPYAVLRRLHKPVDLIILNTDEHVLTNPAVRMASQGGTVDWFRFWLQGYEDPDPTKAEQYARWRELRKLQEKNEAIRTGSKQ